MMTSKHVKDAKELWFLDENGRPHNGTLIELENYNGTLFAKIESLDFRFPVRRPLDNVHASLETAQIAAKRITERRLARYLESMSTPGATLQAAVSLRMNAKGKVDERIAAQAFAIRCKEFFGHTITL